MSSKLLEYKIVKSIATSMFEQKNFTEAIKYYNNAVSIIYSAILSADTDFNLLEYYVICKSNASQCCINLQDFEGAINYATEALVFDPNNVKALYRRGISYLELKQEDMALADFKYVSMLDPDNKAIEKQMKHTINLCLINSVLVKDIYKINSLLAMRADVNFINIDGNTPLVFAITHGHIEMIELLISKGADVHQKINSNYNMLFFASCFGHDKVVKLLISKGVNIHEKTKDGASLLMPASLRGHVKVVELLISKGVSVHDKDNYGSSPLSLATENGHHEVIKLLHLFSFQTPIL